MPPTTFSSREFNHDTGRAKKAAHTGPVIITDRGQPTHVLLCIEEYQKLTRKKPGIVSLLAMHQADMVDFEPPKLSGPLARPEVSF